MAVMETLEKTRLLSYSQVKAFRPDHYLELAAGGLERRTAEISQAG